MLKKLMTPHRAIFAGSLIILLLAVALSWHADSRLHVYVLDIDGHPALVQAPGGKQVLIQPFSATSRLADQFIDTHSVSSTNGGTRQHIHHLALPRPPHQKLMRSNSLS